MANLTLVIDDQLLQSARIKALQENTSVNEICREAIARYAASGGGSTGAERAAKFRALSQQIAALPMEEYVWPGRDAFYDEVLSQRLRGGVDPTVVSEWVVEALPSQTQAEGKSRRKTGRTQT